MLRLSLAILLTVMISACAGATSALADNWQWPSQMNIAGFSITGISGSTRADGSGSASGTLQIPGAGGQMVELTRSSRGDVTGTASLNARMSGAEIQGSFSLSNSGLRGQGVVIRSSPKPITDATVTITSSGQASGSGRLALSRNTVGINFSISSGSFNVSGSSSVRDSTSTALATYDFSGNLSIQGNSGRVSGTVRGSVQRTGKLADQPSSYQVSDVPVDVGSGRCTVNIGGVSVTFTF